MKKHTIPKKTEHQGVIFNLLHSNMRGGIEEMFLHYNQLLINVSYQVVCIVPPDYLYFDKLTIQNSKDGVTESSSQNIIVEILDIHNYFDVKASYQLYKLCKKYQPKYIISHKGRSHSMVRWYQMLFANRLKHKATTIGISHGCTKRLQHFDAVITVSKYLHQTIQKENYSGKLFHVPNFLPDSQLSNLEQDDYNNNNSNVHLTEKENITFGLMGRLSIEKGFDIALDAFLLLAKNKPELNFKVLIAGDGDEKESLIQQVNALELGSKVAFLGWIENKSDYFNQLDVLVVPSIFEPFGMIVLESFNFSIPVISTDVGGPREIITDSVNGLLFNNIDTGNTTESSNEKNSAQNCYHCIERLIHDKPLYDTIAKDGNETLHEKYSEQVAESNLTLVLDTLHVLKS